MFLNYLPSIEKLKRHQRAAEENGRIKKVCLPFHSLSEIQKLKDGKSSGLLIVTTLSQQESSITFKNPVCLKFLVIELCFTKSPSVEELDGVFNSLKNSQFFKPVKPM